MVNESGRLRVGSMENLRTKGCLVVKGGPAPIAVFYDNGSAHAVDNRCPHMGFPLHKGTVREGILTCHWHHARFDLHSGCTFDLFADDAISYPVEVRDGEVYVLTDGIGRDPVEHGKRRLKEGMEQNLRLVIAKAVVGLLCAGIDTDAIARIGGRYGVRHRRSGWASGLTILTAMANVCDHLERDDQIAPLYHGLVHVARDCAGQPPRFDLLPLDSEDVSLDRLKRWFRKFVEVRDPDGAERCLLTAIRQGADDRELADLMVSAATDHFYLDTGHTVDFINKAFELLDRIGWDHAAEVLPSLVRQLSSARRGEEINAWRHPIDLVPILQAAFQQLPELMKAGTGKTWHRSRDFVETLLGEDPNASVAALTQSLQEGARPAQLAQAVAVAAAHRVARFHVQNEFSDWLGVLHTFSYSNALHQMIRRNGSPQLLRGVFHGAMRVYLDRFLNIPPARPFSEHGKAGASDASLYGFLDRLDHQQQTNEAGRFVYRYLKSGGAAKPLYRVLTEALVREDAEFHSFQMLEAAIRQYEELDDEETRRMVMGAAARYLAAHAPTQREMLQTLQVAFRLHRGEPVYEAE